MIKTEVELGLAGAKLGIGNGSGGNLAEPQQGFKQKKKLKTETYRASGSSHPARRGRTQEIQGEWRGTS